MAPLLGYSSNELYQHLMSDENIKRLQGMITKQLDGVHPLKIPIVVKKQAIMDVMNSTFESKSRERIGDIHSRYHQNTQQLRCDYDLMNEQTLHNIVNNIKADFAQQDKFRNFSVWTSEQNKERFNSVKLNRNKIKAGSIPQRF